MNESLNEGERSLLRLEYGVKIKDAIMQNEKGKYFGAGVLQETKLREEIDNMLRNNILFFG